MSEAALLELAAISRANFSFLVTQIIAVQFAVIVAIYLFLNRVGFFLKLSTLVLYTAGYAGLLGIYYWELTSYTGTIDALRALPEKSAAASAAVDWSNGPGKLVSVFAQAIILSNWFVIAFLLFAPVFKGRR